MFAGMLSNKKIKPVVTEIFIRGRKLYISFDFITQSVFAGSKDIVLISMHYFITEISTKGELQQTPFNHSSDNNFKDFVNLYKKCTAKPYSCLVIDPTLISNNSLRFRKNLLERV